MVELQIFDEYDYDYVSRKTIRQAGNTKGYPQLCLGKELKELGLNVGDKVIIGVKRGKYIIIKPL